MMDAEAYIQGPANPWQLNVRGSIEYKDKFPLARY